MRSVLLIAPDFPPRNRQASRRAAAMAKYLTACGWKVTVLTSQPEGYQHPMSAEEVRASAGIPESQIVRRMVPAAPAPRSRLVAKLHGLADILCLPGSPSARWPEQVLPELNGRELAADVVWATAPHWGSFLAASALARRLGVPWVADHRDLPDQFFADAGLRRRLAVWRERAVCRGAAHMTTVSEPMAEMLSRRHTTLVTVIPNGFDPDTLCEKPMRPMAGVFRVVYTGSIWGSEDPAPVVRAISELVTTGEIMGHDMEVLFYGSGDERVRGLGAEGLRAPARAMGSVSLTEAIQAQRQATLLLVLSMKGARGVLTTKLFEYMAAGRPVLAYPKDPECMDRVLTATGVGLSCDSVEELKAVLLRWYREWKQTGDIRTSRNLNEIMKYSRKEQAKALAALLDRVVAEHTGRGA